MSDEEEEYNPKSHKTLLQAISNLNKSQHIRKSSRSEPKRELNEFQLTKSAQIKTQPIVVTDIVRILKGSKKHLDAGKELKNVQSTKKILEKPLEKPEAERIKRKIGYENVKKKLARWDAVVAKNRSSETQVFPLPMETVYVDTSAHAKPLNLAVKSELMLEIEATEAKLRALKKERMGDLDNEEDLQKVEEQLWKKKLTRDELIAKRKELAYLKMRESQKSAKARLQNKIKSKKYRKLLKRQKMQEQIKEFELLKKTNPDAALEKLNALEKSRVQERATLRHKNTGSWAKNLQIRAKYDKDVRKDLAEQLQISRQLTEKKNDEESDENDDDAKKDKIDEVVSDPFNPWNISSTAAKAANNGGEEKENWRKYWLTRNKNDKLLQEYKKSLNEVEPQEMKDSGIPSVTDEAGKTSEPKMTEEKVESMDKKLKLKSKKLKSKKTQMKPVKAKKLKAKVENGWVIEAADIKTANLDDIFDSKEENIKRQLSKKLNMLTAKQTALKSKKKSVKTKKKTKNELKNLDDLTFKSSKERPIIDEELNHEDVGGTNSEKALSNQAIEKVTAETETTSKEALKTEVDTIDPNKIATVNLKQHASSGFMALDNAVMDADIDDEMDEEDMKDIEHQMTISQAFEDDDIVADFTKDKEKDSEIKNAEVDLSMPGWGSWAGAGISEEKRTNSNKRMVLKLPVEERRRDENKDGVYINETASKHLRSHLVSDIPFPFKSVKDYEASIRAPIGRNCVPEVAFRELIRPGVITRKGQVIEPMDESELYKPSRKPRSEVAKRLERAFPTPKELST